MQKENYTVPHHDDVMVAVAKFLSELWFEGEFRDQPEYLAEIFEDILKTELGDDLDLRTKMIGCIKTCKMLVKALEPFSDAQIEEACVRVLEA